MAVYTSIALASLPALWHCLPHQAGIYAWHCSCCGIIVVPGHVVINWVCQRCCLRHLTPALRWRLSRRCAGVVFLIALSFLHNIAVVAASLFTQPRRHQLWWPTLLSVVVTSGVALALSPSWRWCLCNHCAGIITLVALASAHLQLCHCGARAYPSSYLIATQTSNWCCCLPFSDREVARLVLPWLSTPPTVLLWLLVLSTVDSIPPIGLTAQILGDTHMPRSPHYHVLGSPLVSLSPQAFLATKYWASLAHSIGYHLLTSVLEEYPCNSSHNSREHILAVSYHIEFSQHFSRR